MNLRTIASVLCTVFGLILGGCGSSDSSRTEPPPKSDPTPPQGQGQESVDPPGSENPSNPTPSTPDIPPTMDTPAPEPAPPQDTPETPAQPEAPTEEEPTTPTEPVPEQPTTPSSRLSVSVHQDGIPIAGQAIMLHYSNGDTFVEVGDAQGVATFEGLDPKQKITFSIVLAAANQHGYQPVFAEDLANNYPTNRLIMTFVDVFPNQWRINTADLPLKFWPSSYTCPTTRVYLEAPPAQLDKAWVLPLSQAHPVNTPSPFCTPPKEFANPELMLAINPQTHHYGWGDRAASSASQWELRLNRRLQWVNFINPLPQPSIMQVAEMYGVHQGVRYGNSWYFPTTNLSDILQIYLPLDFPMDHYWVRLTASLPNGLAWVRERWITPPIGSIVDDQPNDLRVSDLRIDTAYRHVNWKNQGTGRADYVKLSQAAWFTTWEVYLAPTTEQWQWVKLSNTLQTKLRVNEHRQYVAVSAVDIDEISGYHAFAELAARNSRVPPSGASSTGVFDEASAIKQSGIYVKRTLTPHWKYSYTQVTTFQDVEGPTR
jgi:hypothetical protein